MPARPLFPRALALGSLALGSLALVGCGGSEAETPAATTAADSSADGTVRVEALTVTPGPFDETFEVTANVEAINDAILSAQSSGTVVSLLPLGASVGAGGSVASLDAALARAGIAQAEASVRAAQAGLGQAQAGLRQAQAQQALAEDNFRRQSALYRDSIISALEFEQVRTQQVTAQAAVSQAQAAVGQAQAAVGQTQAGVQQARTGLRNTTVTTPFGGRVEEHFVQRGEQVTPGRQIARVVATGRVKVRGSVPERYAGGLRVGDPVEVSFAGASIPSRTGRIVFVGAAVDPATRTFPVEAEVGNTAGDLKPAMAGRLQLRRGRVEDALVVPRAALVRAADGNAVFVVARTDSGEVAVRRTVTLGSGSPTQVVVTGGLSAGDAVIVDGQNDVSEGARVTVTARRGPAAPAATDTAATRVTAPAAR